MISFREKYRLWRERTFPASKADFARPQDFQRQITEPARVGEAVLTQEKNTQSEAESATRQAQEAGRAFSQVKLSHTVSKPEFVSHSKWQSYLSSRFNKPEARVLEIGSRNVTGINSKNLFFSQADYVGFDFYDGENVDVVGDAHRLSSYFCGQKFDLILSSAVFEHLHMPWLVAYEIHKLLRIGGYVFVETHFSHSTHERPWNFFQFSDMGLKALFNSGMGFEFVDGGMSNRINGVFSQESDEYLRGIIINDLYCHSEILCRKVKDVEEFNWSKVAMDEVVDNTRYPPP